MAAHEHSAAEPGQAEGAPQPGGERPWLDRDLFLSLMTYLFLAFAAAFVLLLALIVFKAGVLDDRVTGLREPLVVLLILAAITWGVVLLAGVALSPPDDPDNL